MADKAPAKNAVLDKKAAQTWARKFNLHVGLIMEQNGLSKAQAIVQAYHEGVAFVGTRMGGGDQGA